MSPTCYLARYATNRGYQPLQACWGDIPLKEGETVLEEKLFRGLPLPSDKGGGSQPAGLTSTQFARAQQAPSHSPRPTLSILLQEMAGLTPLDDTVVKFKPVLGTPSSLLLVLDLSVRHTCQEFESAMSLYSLIGIGPPDDGADVRILIRVCGRRRISMNKTAPAFRVRRLCHLTRWQPERLNVYQPIHPAMSRGSGVRARRCGEEKHLTRIQVEYHACFNLYPSAYLWQATQTVFIAL